jgi:hypothetical protein
MGGWECAGSHSPWRSFASSWSLRALHGTATKADLRGPQQQQKHGFQCEKVARQCEPDAMAKGWKGSNVSRMRVGLADLGHWSLVSAAKWVGAYIYQKLLRKHVVPWVQRKMSLLADLGHWSLVSADKCSVPTSTKSFWESMWSPGFRGHILMQNKSSGGFSAGPCRQVHPTFLGRILDSGGLAAIFARHEQAGFLCFAHSVAKV